MKRCENCIHDKVCDMWAVVAGIPFVNADTCEYFSPTADVAPKSEVERLVDKWIGSGELTPDEKTLRLIEQLRDEAKRYERYYFNHEYDKLIAEAKAEVAREIFEKIDSVMFDRFSNIMLGEDIRLCIAELKKKYQEGEPNG